MGHWRWRLPAVVSLCGAFGPEVWRACADPPVVLGMERALCRDGAFCRAQAQAVESPYTSSERPRPLFRFALRKQPRGARLREHPRETRHTPTQNMTPRFLIPCCACDGFKEDYPRSLGDLRALEAALDHLV